VQLALPRIIRRRLRAVLAHGVRAESWPLAAKVLFSFGVSWRAFKRGPRNN
jgi:hypothetical protein